MNYKRDGLKIRTKACELAAEVLAGRGDRDDAPLPLGWSLAVFFECYMWGGAEGTRREFGPRKPRKLKLVKRG